MAHQIILPKQGLLMTEGLITRWLVEEGGKVEEGQPLFEMETDKLTITIDASAGGTLLKILHPAGDVVPVAEVIAVVGEPGETLDEIAAPVQKEPEKEEIKENPAAAAAGGFQQAPSDGQERMLASPRAQMRAEELHRDWHVLQGTGPDGLIIERDVLNMPVAAATPLARKIARQENIALETITGSGVRGKITADDVREGICLQNDTPAAGEDVRIPFRGMRKTIAENMYASLHTMAQASHCVQVDMTECIRLHQQMKTKNLKVSYNDIIILCAARALREFPAVNASLVGDEIIQKSEVNVGVAVAVDAGLIVPVIRHADEKRLLEIAQESRALSTKAREGTLSPDEIHGGTFTVTNLGMYGIDHFTAIINPPEAAILAVGAVRKQAIVAEDDTIQARSMMWLSLTYDHRIIDGAPAAQFLARIRELLEMPLMLL